MTENTTEQNRPRDKATQAILRLINEKPGYSFSDIREAVGRYYPRKFATGEVFDYILDRILSEYVTPRLEKKGRTELLERKVHYQTSEVERAKIDDLTGLPRRKLFLQFFEMEKQKHPTNWTFVLMDLDNFKDCNSDYGYLGGDQALKGFANLAKTIFNHGLESIVGRWGGEEFLVALPGTEQAYEGKIAELRDAYKQLASTSFTNPESKFQGTFSAGIYHHDFTQGELPVRDIINRVDHALSNAKVAGKDQAVVWSPQLPVSAGK